jgi:hypothetical protein
MAQNPAKTREEFELALSARAATDATFKKALFADPKSTLEREIGQQLGPAVRVHVVEETPSDLYVVLRRPPAGVRKTSGSDDEGLSAEELDNVAGGIGTSAYYASSILSFYGGYVSSGGFEKGGGTGGFTGGV